MMTRREFVGGVAGGLGAMWLGTRLAMAAPEARIRLSACDWSVGVSGPEALDTAKAIGLEGLEISAGGAGDRLPIADAAYRMKYKEAMAKAGIPVSSIAMGLTNDFPMASDPRGPAWLDQTIEAAKDLGAPVILIAFFGKGDLLGVGDGLKKKDVDVVVQRLIDAAPKAKEAGVILGIENYLSAAQNLAILDRIKHDSVRTYYDVGNSTHKDYDVPAELRQMGDRICQIHFKDGSGYLGEGDVDFPGVSQALVDMNYKGWIVLETGIPSKDRIADFSRNAAFARKIAKLI